ncbi:MAG: inositol monophosphatase [Candidatus Schekmanbacteria bacterium RIFCSPHIGHO2_02_FULL_38_11]|uniref:Inositol-1-monophosphatase n=1 Tax=Candidatus Schekmanbacteria bacterium RIFCSPLOWO2_12_FULL_38_15 TaxID=1817883 RepID=A0A1F7SDU3_9BACT|nr:MAG: inositol monophosphatase [Candidatus Schekmanbacteria bacterium GWA2_38_9]OGL49910.1 MAG: inositol monophosphatase [Candidatus Schekmanbacteria bacterium RIFCSPLOWO2_02_FULL_38_14]OGL51669.1 MAG: inositol monophosphatase [Candidatus Schekmanbacteria bacterium RIFCSPHIGHO2_02_FULL_38_11]OGL51949.1 MAG: inositol monophosphatase [Candidatus Schekmanbacteria bacterium RIFCSPLOWO2_12_FULL_38_15]
MDELQKVAIEAALKAGKILRDNVDKKFSIDYKSEKNLVTAIDTAAEKAILGIINEKFPSHSILTEENGEETRDSNFKWIIDPLDGTTNYAHGFRMFCVSIGIEKNGEVIFGVVYDPIADELFTGIKNSGAFLNNKRIFVSKIKSLSDSLLATGFPYDIEKNPKNNLNHFSRFSFNAQAIRRAGSAALDLCYVACGRFDGFWESGLNPWDVAAGGLIVSEARGMVSDFSGKDFSIYRRETLASNGKIHQQMMKTLSKK